MYKSFPISLALTHGARALARGWTGDRMSHAAATFLLVTLFGALSMQTKQIAAGRDPLTLDATSEEGRAAWLQAVMQGGGLGPFGDILFQDKTKFGNNWATLLAGPMAAAVEDVGGQWALKNVERAIKGDDTHFLGDGLWILSRYVPGSSLWYAKRAFQAAIVDQALLAADERAPERFQRIEERAQKDYGQSYWWRRGEATPRRAPAFGGAQ